MKKQNDQTFKTIQDVIFADNKIFIVIDDKKIQISKEYYSDNHLYPNKNINKEEYYEILNSAKYIKVSTYLSGILANRMYTEYEVKNKLKTKFKLKENEIDKLLLPYIQSQIIDDKNYALSFIASKLENGYGRRYIIEHLKQKGIKEDILKDKEIENLFLDNDYDLFSLIEQYDKSKSSLPYEKRKRNVMLFLQRKGFSLKEIEEPLNDYFSEEVKNPDIEFALLKKELYKCYNNISKKNVDSKKKKEMLIRSLLSKSFSYEDIKEIIEKENIKFYD